MRRYARLYLCFLRFSASRALEFRFDFTFRIFMDTLWYAVHLGLFGVLYGHTASLGGWSHDQALVFLGGLFVADAIQMTLLSNNMWMLPIYINKGDLDYHLVRPVSSLFLLSLREVAFNSAINLAMAIGILAWALARYPAPLGALPIAGFVGLLLLGVFLHWCLQLLFLIPTFWMQNQGGLRDLFWGLDTLSSRPVGIFPGWARRILVSFLPFALIVSFPALALFDGTFGRVALHLGATCAAFFGIVLLAWRAGLRAYSSASS